MILHGNQRAGGSNLAQHLLNAHDNDHVTVHEIRGFVSDNLPDAFNEAYAVSRGTKCKQFLFSLSLSPPETESVGVDVFEKAIEDIEAQLNLTGQPRAVVFHEKHGRRHAHCVWSRIDVETMTAINLPYSKMRLREASQQLFIDNEWQMPNGLVDSQNANPLNYSQSEFQQAQRARRNPKIIKQEFQQAWAMSDGAKSFQSALQSIGYGLAKGDRRGFVTVDKSGEVYSLSRWCGVKTKELRGKLGDPDQLPSIAEVHAALNTDPNEKFEQQKAELQTRHDANLQSLKDRSWRTGMHQQHERMVLLKSQHKRQLEEISERQSQFKKGLRGLWNQFTGIDARLRAKHEEEFTACQNRDRKEMDDLVTTHLAVSQRQEAVLKVEKQRHETSLQALRSRQKQEQDTRFDANPDHGFEPDFDM